MTPGEISRLSGVDVSRETFDQLTSFVELVKKWTAKINLVSRASLPEIWTRHIADSLQLWPLRSDGARLWADLGSGGGFPALPLAIVAKAQAPDLRFVLVESDLRKSVFLNTAIRDLSLNASVETARIEDLPSLGADIVSARALAPLPTLLTHAERHLKPGGIALFPKGATHAEEETAAMQSWRFTAEFHPSRTDVEAVIMKIGGISRV